MPGMLIILTNILAFRFILYDKTKLKSTYEKYAHKFDTKLTLCLSLDITRYLEISWEVSGYHGIFPTIKGTLSSCLPVQLKPQKRLDTLYWYIPRYLEISRDVSGHHGIFLTIKGTLSDSLPVELW